MDPKSNHFQQPKLRRNAVGGAPTGTVAFIGGAFPTYLLWIRRPSGLRELANETYDAGLSLDVARRVADNFVYTSGLGKHRHMA